MEMAPGGPGVVGFTQARIILAPGRTIPREVIARELSEAADFV